MTTTRVSIALLFSFIGIGRRFPLTKDEGGVWYVIKNFDSDKELAR